MNIIGMRQEKRQQQINQIIASIKKALDENKDISYKKIVLATRLNLNLSDRTAQEYVQNALFSLGFNKDLKKDKNQLKLK